MFRKQWNEIKGKGKLPFFSIALLLIVQAAAMVAYTMPWSSFSWCYEILHFILIFSFSNRASSVAPIRNDRENMVHTGFWKGLIRHTASTGAKERAKVEDKGRRTCEEFVIYIFLSFISSVSYLTIATALPLVFLYSTSSLHKKILVGACFQNDDLQSVHIEMQALDFPSQSFGLDF